MNYSNEGSDKSIRQKKYYTAVYIFPLLGALLICGMVYCAAAKHFVSQTDSYYGYFVSFTIFFLFMGLNKRNWVKMPDGAFLQTKHFVPGNIANRDEPAHYEEEYFISRKKMTSQVLLGVTAVGLGIFLALDLEKSILIPMGTMATGLFLSYRGLTGFLNYGPQLKLAKKGLWTRKLGFVDWKDISRAEVVEDSNGKKSEYILDIFLKGTNLTDANQPDERLNITQLENYQYIEMAVENLISKRYELKR